MPKSSTKRKNGRNKKCVKKDSAGNIVNSKNTKQIRNIRIKQMLRMQLLNSACQSLTACEVKIAIDKGSGHKMSYISTELDKNGVPVDGVTKQITLSNIDVARLESIWTNKLASEKQMKK